MPKSHKISNQHFYWKAMNALQQYQNSKHKIFYLFVFSRYKERDSSKDTADHCFSFISVENEFLVNVACYNFKKNEKKSL